MRYCVLEDYQKQHEEDTKISNWVFNRYFHKFWYMREDFIQSAIIDLWLARSKFDIKKGKYSTYAHTVAYNAMQKIIRKEKNCLDDVSFDDELSGSFDNTEAKWITTLMGQICDVLPESKQIIKLLVDGYNANEITKKLNLPQMKVRRQIAKFRELLRIALDSFERID
jgi:RNA polymerase sigma factor (sigma-70 family)